MLSFIAGATFTFAVLFVVAVIRERHRLKAKGSKAMTGQNSIENVSENVVVCLKREKP